MGAQTGVLIETLVHLGVNIITYFRIVWCTHINAQTAVLIETLVHLGLEELILLYISE